MVGCILCMSRTMSITTPPRRPSNPPHPKTQHKPNTNQGDIQAIKEAIRRMGDLQAEALVAQNAKEAELSKLLQDVIHETNPRAQRAKAVLQVGLLVLWGFGDCGLDWVCLGGVGGGGHGGGGLTCTYTRPCLRAWW